MTMAAASPLPANADSKVTMDDSTASKTRVFTGKVVWEQPNGNMRREICTSVVDGDVIATNAKQQRLVVVHLYADRFSGTEVWMRAKGARKLICPGVVLRIEGIPVEEEEDSAQVEMLTSNSNDDKDTIEQVLYATSIQVVTPLPRSPYLARLLSFEMETLWELFPSDKENNNNDNEDSLLLPPGLVSALAPCSAAECHALLQLAKAEREKGRNVLLFKHPHMVQFASRLQEYHLKDEPGRRPAAPRTSRAMWNALRRMEERWCRDEVDGTPDEYVFHLDTYSYTTTSITEARNSHNGRGAATVGDLHDENGSLLIHAAVDPAHNLPDTSNERRQRYIDERKRPQVQAMLRLICTLLPLCDGSGETPMRKKKLHLVEIGGGRGYLAMAVAAYLTKDLAAEQTDVHVTVIDNNESSLAAGRAHAEAANLTSCMSFVLCDMGNPSQMEQLHQCQEDNPFDIVFGLHCCGGLAEAAVELAIASQASFCVSTCCFRSNGNLASLSHLAEALVARSNSGSFQSSDTLCQEVTDHDQLLQHKEDVSRVSALALRDGGLGQHRAIRAYNAMRLIAAEQRFESLSKSADMAFKHPGRMERRLRTWQETFPVEHSVQNRVLMGTFSNH